MRTAFVTGATGFLGLNLVAELSGQGWRVFALHRRSSRLDDLCRFPVDLVEGDIRDPPSLRRAVPPKVDAVFHVAGNTSLWSPGDAEQTRDNVDGTRCVVEAAVEAGARRFVLTSSVAAIGQHGTRVTEETASTAEASGINYFRTKRLGERVVEEAGGRGLDAVILNPGNIVGPYDRHNWSRMIRLVIDGKLPGVPPGRNSWCHAREVARAHVAAAERGRRGHHYILSCVEASYLEFVQTIAELTGRRSPTKATPAFALRTYARWSNFVSRFTRREPDVTPEAVAIVCDDTTYDSTKAQRELGYRPASLQEMVGDCLAWMKAERIVS
jgi:nucleoside-diphosphate-sugar epimerase